MSSNRKCFDQIDNYGLFLPTSPDDAVSSFSANEAVLKKLNEKLLDEKMCHKSEGKLTCVH